MSRAGWMVVFIWVTVPVLSRAQETVAPAQDTAVQIVPAVDTLVSLSRYNPRKALLYSAALPGLGQIYNRKYWKLPFVYGGFVAGVLIVQFWDEQYQTFRAYLFDALARGSQVGSRGTPIAQLRSIVDRTRRDRDFWIAMTGFWYVIQMIDAHVDAHLHEFKINPKLNVRLEPSLQNDPLAGRSTGVALVFRF